MIMAIALILIHGSEGHYVWQFIIACIDTECIVQYNA